jgi:hypothetical protein
MHAWKNLMTNSCFVFVTKAFPSVKNPQQTMRVEKYILGDNFWRAMLFGTWARV